MDKERSTITVKEINKYRKITEKAFEIAKNSINKDKQKEAKEIIEMVDCYLKDSIHFENKKDLINAFGAIYYAHGWLDSGARLKIFNVTDNTLFTI